MAITFDVNITSKVLGVINTMAKSFSSAKKDSKELTSNVMSLSEALDKSKKFTYIDNILGGMGNKLDKIAEKKAVFDMVGGRAGIFGKELMSVGQKLSLVTGNSQGLGKAFEMFGGQMMASSMAGKGFIKSIGSGFSAVFTGIRIGSITAMASITGLMTLLGTFVAPILAVVAAIYIFKKVWDANIGGMQTSFSKIMGRLKSISGILNANLITALRAIGPLFSGIFSALESTLDPILDAFEELNKMFKQNSQSLGVFTILAKVLGFQFKVIGVVIGTLIRATLYPLMLIFKAISLAVKGLDIVWKAFANTAVFKTILTFVLAIRDAFIQIKDTIESIPFLGKGSPAAESSGGGGSSRTVNNNQQITFQTNRVTSPEQSQSFVDSFARMISDRG